MWGDSLLTQKTEDYLDVGMEGFIDEPIPEASGARDQCANCGHERRVHILGRYDCCLIVRRTTNLVNDLTPVHIEQSTICDCEEFVN